MIEIVPTITATTPDDYARELARLDFAPRLHIDIADGDLAPNRTVNLNQIYFSSRHSGLDPESSQTIDLHLMIRRPAEWLHQIIALAPDLVILHAEIDEPHVNLPKIFEHLRKFDIKCGLAILPETRTDDIREIIEIADHVLIFGGHLGYQGGTADLKQLAKVAQVRAINPHAEIAWDGGANLDNAIEIAAAGVEVINVGSAIAKTDNPEKSWQNLVEILANV
jgi:ribulose-phosphate 3-epimerase